jgi:Tfp pilus assembly protein PilO
VTETAAGQVRIAWLLVALAAALGFASIVLPAQRRVAAIEERAAGLADLAARNEALLARLDSLEQTRTRVRRDLERLSGKMGTGRTTVAVLHVLEDEAGRNHLTITGIAPAGEEPSAPRLQREEDVAVSLRGRYRDVMAAIADVSRHDALVEVQSVALTRVDTRQLFPSVDATVRVALYPDVKALVKEETHAQTPAH